MNFVFWLAVVCALVAFWFCLCAIFPVIGNWFFNKTDILKSNIEKKENQENEKSR